MATFKQSFADYFRELRRYNKFTVKKLAHELEISPTYISKIECNNELPTNEFICKAANLFKVTPNHLLLVAKSEKLKRYEQNLDWKLKRTLKEYRNGI